MINIFSTSTFYNKKFFISTFLLIILILNLFLFKDVYEEQSISILFLEKIHSIPKDISKIFKYYPTTPMDLLQKEHLAQISSHSEQNGHPPGGRFAWESVLFGWKADCRASVRTGSQ